ncbi:uncharacterized protein DDB_G0286299-like [Enoplosus armatus]|uniref:uncharacterized protein DDB_G0286299-like n=1 Tax=Enoplosus armatus TaxID=215367 RepID=UPI003996BF9D
MSSVQSMRQFVCDRLTAAAQDILKAFEKKIEDHEAEIARQRRLLESVLTPETKLQLAELTQTSVRKEALLNQQQNYNQERTSSFVPPDPPQIKEEHEEMCVSQERLQTADTSKLTPSCEGSVHRDQSQPSDPDQTQSAANKDPQSSISNKEVLPGSDGESSAVSAPSSDHQLLSHNSCVAESQDHITCSHESATRHIESTPNKKSNDKNTVTSAEQTSDKKSNNRNTTSATEPTPNKKSNDETTKSTKGTELTRSETHNDDNPTSKGNNAVK